MHVRCEKAIKLSFGCISHLPLLHVTVHLPLFVDALIHHRGAIPAISFWRNKSINVQSVLHCSQQRAENHQRAFQRRRKSQVTFRRQAALSTDAQKESVWRPNSLGFVSVFCKSEENSSERSSFSQSVKEKRYLHVKGWAKAGVAVETGLITARPERCFIKMFRPQHTEQLLKPGEPQITSLFIKQQHFLHLAPTGHTALVSPSCVSWGKFTTAES